MEQTNKLFSILHDELQQDSDRSCAIVAASIIDTILGDAILARLVPDA